MRRCVLQSVKMLTGVLVVLLASGAFGQRQSKPRQRTPMAGTLAATVQQDALTISVVPLSNGGPVAGGTATQGSLDLGTVSYASRGRPGTGLERTHNGIRLNTRFGLQVDDSSGSGCRAATLAAFITFQQPLIGFRIDGVQLSSAPVIVQPVLRCGLTEHVLEVEIPSSFTEPVVSNAIGFVATGN